MLVIGIIGTIYYLSLTGKENEISRSSGETTFEALIFSELFILKFYQTYGYFQKHSKSMVFCNNFSCIKSGKDMLLPKINRV